VAGRLELLVPRLLLLIPAHFRELARREQDADAAFITESTGWMLMWRIREDIRAATGRAWWLPRSPRFAGPMSSTAVAGPTGLFDVLGAARLVTATFEEYVARRTIWMDGAAGRQWRLETGADATPTGPGRPFYPAVVSIPAPRDPAPARAAATAAWTERLRETDARLGVRTDAATAALRACRNELLPAGTLGTANLGRLGLLTAYPALEGAREVSELRVNAAIADVATAVFRAVDDLGWSDMLFETQGAACFRGIKLPADSGRPNRHHDAARRTSQHGFGLAIDVNVFENGQGSRGYIDPRAVALFEAFGFAWGRCFGVTDPMHFEYCGSSC
jgi:hypothetical protein